MKWKTSGGPAAEKHLLGKAGFTGRPLKQPDKVRRGAARSTKNPAELAVDLPHRKCNGSQGLDAKAKSLGVQGRALQWGPSVHRCHQIKEVVQDQSANVKYD